MNPKFFPKPIDFRKWLEKNHNKEAELLVGFYKKNSGKQSISWPESVDQALCFGWIDGIRKSLGEESYTIRFTPRREKSHWSAVNLKRFAQLRKLGQIQEAGLRAFSKINVKNLKRASFEQKDIAFETEFEAKIKANKKAWAFFQKLAPSHKKSSIWWVISAKREETKLRRLGILIRSCEVNEKIPALQIARKK